MSNNESAVKQAKDNSNKSSNESITEIKNQAEQSVATLKEKVSEKFSTLQDKTQVAKEKVSENLSGVADKVHLKADQTQEFLDKKTDDINAMAHQTIEKVNELGHRAGDALNSSSEFIRNFDVEETRQQVKEKIQSNPGISLAVAGIFGLMIGLLLRRNKSTFDRQK